jgi:hypothetical protein
VLQFSPKESFSTEQLFHKENEESFDTFRNIQSFEMESSIFKLINYLAGLH